MVLSWSPLFTMFSLSRPLPPILIFFLLSVLLILFPATCSRVSRSPCANGRYLQPWMSPTSLDPFFHFSFFSLAWHASPPRYLFLRCFFLERPAYYRYLSTFLDSDWCSSYAGPSFFMIFWLGALLCQSPSPSPHIPASMKRCLRSSGQGVDAIPPSHSTPFSAP